MFKNSKILVISIFSIVISLWLIAYYEIIPGFKVGDAEVLIASLGFAGLVINIYFQQIEIKQTKDDQYIQRFENGFFILFKEFLDAQNSIKHTDPIPKIINLDTLEASLEIINDQQPLNREVFIKFNESVQLFIDSDYSKNNHFKGTLHTINNAYAKSTHIYRRRLQILFDYILKSDIDVEKTKIYIQMVINQMMYSEVTFNYFQSLVSDTNSSMRQVFKKYPDFKNFSSIGTDYYKELLEKD